MFIWEIRFCILIFKKSVKVIIIKKDFELSACAYICDYNIYRTSTGFTNKKRCLIQRHLQEDICDLDYPFNLSSGDTESFFLPFALRAARTLLPLGVDILSLKPCLFTLFLLDGW